jgi:alcohol dehydrogenase class IV
LAKFVLQYIPLRTPTLLTGEGAIQQLCETVCHFEVGKILVVTDEVLYKVGALGELEKCLKEKNATVSDTKLRQP